MPAAGEDPPVGVRVLPRDRRPRPGADHEQRHRKGRRRAEAPAAGRLLLAQSVAEDGPRRVGRHRQRQGRLQVVLVEAGEDAVGDVHAAVRRHVGLAVRRVGEAVHALAGGDVGQTSGHHRGDGLADGEAGQADPVAVVRRGRGDAVEDHGHVRGVPELQEGALGGAGEPHLGAAGEAFGSRLGQVEVHGVGDARQHRRPGASLGPRECHGATLRPGCGAGRRCGRGDQ